MKIINVQDRQNSENEVINQCLEYLDKNGGTKIPLGRHNLENSDIYVNVSEYTTRQIEESIWEAHKKYADLQVLLVGEEQVLVSQIEAMNTGVYHEDSDYLECNGECEKAVKIDKDTCLLLFPEDVHMPGICLKQQPMNVKKAVVKIPMHHF